MLATMQRMTLGDVAALLGVEAPAARDLRLADITHDSRRVKDGALYFCIPGERFDGHDFGLDAAAGGAAALVVEHRLEVPLPQLIVPSARDALSRLAGPFFGDPSTELRVVGITGTNGKTALSHLLHAVCSAAGVGSEIIGTVGTADSAAFTPRSTPEAPDLQRTLRQMVDEGVDVVALEATSIGIGRGRLEGVRFAVSVFTNLTRDHLDQHDDMESYFNIKERIFDPEVCKTKVVNIDDAWGARLEAGATTYGLSGKALIGAEDLVIEGFGSTFRITGTGSDELVRLNLPGRFNVSNALGAAATAHSLGMDGDTIAEGLSSLQVIPGRMEKIDEGQQFTIFVDYAHSPDGLEKALEACRAMTESRVIVVFGAEGDSDRGKRPLMGEVAGRLSDLAIVTSDNPMTEDPEKVIGEIAAGIEPAPPALGYQTEPDRSEAIRSAISQARRGDIVLVAGKGHETVQSFGDRNVPFDDRVVVRRHLQELP